MQFDAKCPYCFGEPLFCEHCGGTGTMPATLEEDVPYYTRHCTNPECGFDNGGCRGDALGDRDLMDSCIMCKHPEVVWIPFEDQLEDPPWRTHQLHNPFAQYLLELEQKFLERGERNA